jgi:ABC-type dipeptide/oligopeptide/nickel transport system permease component
MIAIAIRRLAQMIPVALLVSLFVFLLLHIAPGDPVRMMASPTAKAEDIERIRERLGLNDPLPVQYLRWLGNALTGDFGESMRSGAPVSDLLPGRLWNTLRLALLSMALAIVVGILGGMLAALRPGSLLDTLAMTVSVASLSIPPFWLGLMLILFFSVRLGWLPAGGGDSWRHALLPALSLGLSSAALIARMVRSTLLEVLRQDFVRAARARGLSERALVARHAMPNVLVPTITVIGLQFGALLAGAVVTEVVFSWPGMGSLLVTSIGNRDFSVVQAALLAVSISFLLVNLATDLLYAVVDPRLRVG